MKNCLLLPQQSVDIVISLRQDSQGEALTVVSVNGSKLETVLFPFLIYPTNVENGTLTVLTMLRLQSQFLNRHIHRPTEFEKL